MTPHRRPAPSVALHEMCRARFQSPFVGSFELLMSRGCERFVGRFPLLPELRGGDRPIRFSRAVELADPRS